jgi:hypothetical protein
LDEYFETPVEVKLGMEARGNHGLEEEMVAEVGRDYY